MFAACIAHRSQIKTTFRYAKLSSQHKVDQINVSFGYLCASRDWQNELGSDWHSLIAIGMGMGMGMGDEFVLAQKSCVQSIDKLLTQ